ncbi:2-oxoglutarate dehydrogenase, partial [Operophtera brumata]
VKDGIADWSIGEAIGIGSILRDNIHIRFTGEDVERGTMAHSPKLLAIWEAQYGDFADTAQPVFDTFIANGESKWVQQSGVVVQLPHGIDGAGPEHSSARVERFLAASDDDEDLIPNLDDKMMELANVTTPANYFHLIRRQVAMPFRKPLILMTPKIGLKHPYYRSPFKDFLPGTSFQRAIRESGPASKKPECVKKLIFCVGKVALTIDELRKEKKIEDKIALCRIEQIYPFPYDIVLQEFCLYENAKVCFCQEEHKNQGPWIYCKMYLKTR